MSLDFSILTGRSEEHLVFAPELTARVHGEILLDLIKLREDAGRAGFELTLASAFRSHERQLQIFNAKARGEKPLLNSQGQKLDSSSLSEEEKLLAILRWSALPGSSRHHWGTDLDVFDKAAISQDYQLQLIPQEFENGGPFERFHDWLDEQMQNARFPFFRPYAQDKGGVSPERWHLSHKLALSFDKEYSFEIFKKNIELSELQMKGLILDMAQELFRRFVKNTTTPPWP